MVDKAHNPPVSERRGWGFPGASRKAHYFDDDLISLCGKWMFSGDLDASESTSPDDCAACRKKLDKKHPAEQQHSDEIPASTHKG